MPNKQWLIDKLNIYYGIEVIKLTLLPLGADINASVYKADTKDKLSYFVKLKVKYNYDISTTITELLHDVRVQQIIPPIKTISGQPTQRIDDFTLIVYPFIEGQNGFIHALSNEQWLMLGKTLKEIHDIDVPISIQHQLRRETYPSKWREKVRSFYQQIEAQQTGDEVTQKLLAFMKQNSVAILRLVDGADELAQKLQNVSSKFVLCHSDIHAGNVLLNADSTIYIVDWDEPMMAPKERDLMFIGGGVGNVWNNSYEEALFYEGYGKTDVNTTMLAYYRHERIVQDIAEYVEQLILTAKGGTDRIEMFKQFVSMFAEKGVVEIAFETAER